MMNNGNFPEACRKLAKSEQLDPQVGTMLNLAYCYESVGKTASACGMWRDAAAAAASKSQPDREALAQQRAERLCTHIPRVTVQVATQRTPIDVTINRTQVPRDQWGLPTPLDPGVYELHASGVGVMPWSSNFAIENEAAQTVTVPELAPAPDGAVVDAKGPASRRQRELAIATWVSAGAGAASVGVGAGFGVAAVNREVASNSDRRCVVNACNAEGASDRASAVRTARVADVMFAVGGASLVTSAILWVISSHPPARSAQRSAASRLYVAPSLAPRGGGLFAGASW